MKPHKKGITKFIVIAVIALIIFISGTTYALWQMNHEQTDKNTIIAGCFKMNFTELSSSVELLNAYPISDAKGKKTAPYKFKIENDCTLNSSYDITLDIMDATTDINLDKIKIYLEGDQILEPIILTELTDKYEGLSNEAKDNGIRASYVLASADIEANSDIINNYNLRIWIDESAEATADIMNRKLDARLTITSTATKTNTADNIIVDLADNMIPVVYDETKSAWVKAEVNNQDSTYRWYDYNKQKWANAVLVKDAGINTRDRYKNIIEAGTEIKDADILAFYVYIPRYKYKLFNVDGKDGLGPREIQIAFENNKTALTLGEENGEWLTHPAFCFGDKCDIERTDTNNKEINGIWVGKFETTGTIATNGITIRPNTAALTNQTVGAMFNASRAIQTTTNNVYGFPDSTKADSHMIKNMEWGAVAYLSHSKYGKYGNPIYTGATGLEKEVWINNSNTYQTGCAGASVSAAGVSGCANAYTTTNGQKASTTGNISGIYDMSGGTVEYVMGNMSSSTSSYVFYPSGSTGFTAPTAKYYDKYENSASQLTHERGLLGDATKETLTTFGSNTGGWYSDNANFTSSTHSWFLRGGIPSHGAGAGVFAFICTAGEADSRHGFRLVYSILQNNEINK